MRPAILVCLTDEEGLADPDATEEAACRVMPGVTFGKVVVVRPLLLHRSRNKRVRISRVQSSAYPLGDPGARLLGGSWRQLLADGLPARP